MSIIILSIHLVVSICLIGLVLLQRSEGGALGIGGGGGGSLMSGRGASDALARLTSIAGGLFLAVSLFLTWLSGVGSTGERSVFDIIPQAPISAPATPAPAPTPEPTREDPTESRGGPAAQENTFAAVLPGPAPAAAAPAPVQVQPTAAPTAARAAPIEGRPTAQPTARQAPAQTAANPPARQQPTQAAATPPVRTPAPQLQIPTAQPGAVNGVQLSEPGQGESVEMRNGLEVVRRERAGPEQ